MTNPAPTAALLIIGNEILSGRTQDANARYIAVKSAEHGIRLEEIRVVPDIQSRIVDALNTLRRAYDYVFTTGGIGPTHDDITSEAVAAAFGVPYCLHAQAHAILLQHYGEEKLNDGRLKMAMLPEGSAVITNSVSGAPGFRMENVFIMAGIPRIMQAMFDAALPLLRKGAIIESREIHTEKYESVIAETLSLAQERYGSAIDIGSYPSTADGFKGVTVILRGTDGALLDEAAEALSASITHL